SGVCVLGRGGKYVSVPFNALQVTEKNGKLYLVMDTTKEALTSAPGYRYDSTTGKSARMRADQAAHMEEKLDADVERARAAVSDLEGRGMADRGKLRWA